MRTKYLREQLREPIARAVWRFGLRRARRAKPGDYGNVWSGEREKLYEKYGHLTSSRQDIELLKKLRNRYANERIFILGNGPSLNRTPLEKLKGEYTFGVNRIYLIFDRIDWRPTFYTVVDWRVAGDCSDEINRLRGMNFFFPERFRGLLREGDDVYYYWHGPARSAEEAYFAQTMDHGIRGAGSVTGSAIQIAYHLGFDPIYLIGVDASYKVLPTVMQTGPDRFGDGVLLRLESTEDDDPNHFDPRYFGKGRKWHNPNVPRMIEGYRACRQGIESKGRRIYNATVGGELEIFERLDFDSLF